MADDRKNKNSHKSSGPATTPLERYLAKQKQDKVAQPVGRLVERPSLQGIERPAPTEKPQPERLSRWESVPEVDVQAQYVQAQHAQVESEIERRAREAGAPPLPPRFARAAEPPGTSQPSGASQSSVGDSTRPMTDTIRNMDDSRNATFGPRALATIVDGCILYTISYFVQKISIAVFAVVFGSYVEIHRDGLVYLISVLATYTYYGYFYSVRGASPGKMMLSLEVLDADGATKLTPWKAFFREGLGKMISAVPFFMGYVIVLIRRDRRALHDLLFDTRVIKKSGSNR